MWRLTEKRQRCNAALLRSRRISDGDRSDPQLLLKV